MEQPSRSYLPKDLCEKNGIIVILVQLRRAAFPSSLRFNLPQIVRQQYPMLLRPHILLKDAGAFFEAETARLKAHAKALADDSGRPFVYLNAAHTHATGSSKESPDCRG